MSYSFQCVPVERIDSLFCLQPDWFVGWQCGGIDCYWHFQLPRRRTELFLAR